MIGTLARKRMHMRVSHLAAVATLVALLGAMFVSVGSVGAQETTPACAVDADITLNKGESCEFMDLSKVGEGADTVTDPNEDPVNNVVSVSGTTVTASSTLAGTEHIEVTRPTSSTDNTAVLVKRFRVTVNPLGISKISVDGDSDGIVEAGTAVTLKVATMSASGDAEARLTVPTTGLSIEGEGEDTVATTQRQVSSDSVNGVFTFNVITDGAPNGTYTLTVVVDDNGFDSDNDPDQDKDAKDTFDLTVSDPGVNVEAAKLSLARTGTDDAATTRTDESKPGTGQAVAADGAIQLTVMVTNGMDNAANNNDVERIYVSTTTGGVVGTDEPGAKGSSSSFLTISGTDAMAKTSFWVAKGDKRPGTVEVTVDVDGGSSGRVESNTLTLTFTGPADMLSLADGASALNSAGSDENMLDLAVTAMDEGGLNVPVPEEDVIVGDITDPEGDLVVSGIAAVATKDKNDKTVVRVTGSGASLTPGTYTIEISHRDIDDLEASASFAVAGPAANVMLEVDNANPGIDEALVVVTATVTDKDGNAVPKDTSVTFNASGNSAVLERVGAAGKMTDADGVATAQFFVIGAGTSRVLVTVAGGAASERVVVSDPAAEAEEEAMTEPEMVGNHCIENKGGFAVWTCGVSAMASEVFALVQPEGATAIHLWSTISMSWVRYSVVDGTTVPGSSDFMVTENSILYISN